jgi:UDP:flavonoid glycosyltransferase YjiC (YdhE family)
VASVLFVTWDGGGNVAPVLLIAREIQLRGGEVRILGHAPQRRSIEAAGFAFEAYARARSHAVLEPRSRARADLGYAAVFADRGIGRDVVESLRRKPADRVVVDGLLIGALAALDGAGMKYTILVHTLRSAMYPAVTRGPLGIAMRLNGFRPGGLYARAERELVVTEPTLDAGYAGASDVVRYTGAVLPAAVEALPDARHPLIVVSLSTTYIGGQPELLQRIIDAMAPSPAQVVVTTGPAVAPSLLRPAANTELHAFLPHSELMRRAALVIGHGGHATTMLALAHGVPLVVIPMNPSFDQPAIARMVAEHGVGLTVPKRAPADRIRTTVDRVLADDEYTSTARRLGETLRARRAASRAADLLRD